MHAYPRKESSWHVRTCSWILKICGRGLACFCAWFRTEFHLEVVDNLSLIYVKNTPASSYYWWMNPVFLDCPHILPNVRGIFWPFLYGFSVSERLSESREHAKNGKLRLGPYSFVVVIMNSCRDYFSVLFCVPTRHFFLSLVRGDLDGSNLEMYICDSRTNQFVLWLVENARVGWSTLLWNPKIAQS